MNPSMTLIQAWGTGEFESLAMPILLSLTILQPHLQNHVFSHKNHPFVYSNHVFFAGTSITYTRTFELRFSKVFCVITRVHMCSQPAPPFWWPDGPLHYPSVRSGPEGDRLNISSSSLEAGRLPDAAIPQLSYSSAVSYPVNPPEVLTHQVRKYPSNV